MSVENRRSAGFRFPRTGRGASPPVPSHRILMAWSCPGQLQPKHSRASAGLTTIYARIAGSTGFHQAAARDTRRRIADVVKELRVADRAGIQPFSSTIRTAVWTKERELFPREEPQLHPAEKIIHDGLCVADLRVSGPAGRLKTCMRQLVAEHFQWHSMLKAD